jgi:hypothetical protein
LLLELFGLRMSVGAAVGCQELASAAIAEPVEEARAHVVVAERGDPQKSEQPDRGPESGCGAAIGRRSGGFFGDVPGLLPVLGAA